jgi:diacylglycerol kinase (ATP)
MRIAVIINPVAGRGRRGPVGDERARLARRLTEKPGIHAEIRVTRQAGHGAELAREFREAGHDLVVAWGGDGTVNEVAGPLIGGQTALAIVPAGSGDGLARGLGVPARPEDAIALAVSARAGPLDVGFIGTRHFLNIAGIGFDAAVAVGFARAGRYGTISYARQAFGRLWAYRSANYELVTDGSPFSGRLFLVAFANGRQYGNGLVIAPDADPADGLLNAIVVDDGTAISQLWRARRLFVNKLGPAGGVRRVKIREASVESTELFCHVDGEPFETSGRLDIRVEPGGLSVVGSIAGACGSA